VKFKSMSTRKFSLRRMAEGIFEYVPVVFEEQHFCVSLCTVHSSLLNFQFRTRPLRHQIRSKCFLKLTKFRCPPTPARRKWRWSNNKRSVCKNWGDWMAVCRWKWIDCRRCEFLRDWNYLQWVHAAADRIIWITKNKVQYLRHQVSLRKAKERM
jgi:hypothetical protein